MHCNGDCKKYKASKPFRGSPYDIGAKRCQVCEIYIKWNGRDCPCCGSTLRSKPRQAGGKARLAAMKEMSLSRSKP